MAKLINKTKNITISETVEEAKGIFSRMKGLLGKTNYDKKKALHIRSCNSVHTCFMKFAIDVVFVDKSMKVKHISNNVTPWNVVLPILSAKSVFEFKAGVINEDNLSVGDHLHVGD